MKDNVSFGSTDIRYRNSVVEDMETENAGMDNVEAEETDKMDVMNTDE